MAIIKSFSPFQNLSNFDVEVVDTDPNSFYFRITEFQETFTGGKNGFLIEGSEFLKPTTEVKLELLDVEGNPIFFIPGDGIPEYYEGVSKLVSVHVYEDTPIGQGKITILGELERYIDDQGIEREVPDEWKGVYNVKWERTFRVNKNLNNETIVRFVKRPQVQIDEIIKPFFTKQIPQITQTGTASGIGENPSEGTNLTGYTAGTLYRIAITDNTNFTASVDENIITFPNLGYSSRVREVLNNKEVLVDVPYTENNVITNFQDESYTTTFEDLESQTSTESALTGSFAKVKINRLKTFVGDVARVKVFRKSRNEIGDFQLVQDARIESTELLRDITVQDDTEVFYGNFTQNILDTYWISGSDDHPITLDDSKLFGGIQIDYNEGVGGTQTFITSESFEIEDDVEYTLSFKTIFDGTPNTDKNIRVLLSGSNYEQVISTTIPSTSFNTRQNISQNFIATTSSLDAKLQFEFVGSDWYISKVSLKNAQETSFSPDELTLIQDVPRKLPQETFDFRFEFYDVNNNFIPVSVNATKEFVGGNNFRTDNKLFTFESDRTAFRFITGSVGNPPFQQIRFSNTTQNLTGSVLYTSQAFDIDGNLITSESYHDSGVLEYPGGFSGSYPGLLQNPSNAGALLPIANFSGSVSGVTVGSIIYTASLEGTEEFETIFRFEDGEDAPALIVTSNTNQFIYEPTELRPKPLGQEVRIKAQRKNLASITSPITIHSGSGSPPLTVGTDTNGIANYSILATSFSASFAGQNGAFPEVTYEFTSSDEFNNEFTDEITVSPVVNFDGLSVILSNEMTSFRANSQGLVLDDFESGDGEVEVRIGENVIQHSNGLVVRNSFDVVGSTPTNVTEKNDGTYPDETYGITALTADSGSIILDIKYLAGDNETSQSFTKKVNYTKNRISPPAIIVDVENRVQNKSAKSTGEQLQAFEDSTITVQQIYTGSVSGLSSPSLTILSDPSDVVDSTTTNTITFGDLPDGVDSSIVSFEVSGTDSEGATRTIQDSISLSKSPNGVPAVEFQITPNAQTIESDSTGGGTSTPQTLIVSGREGGISLSPTLSNLSFTGGLNGNIVSNTIVFSNTVGDMTQDTGTVSVDVSGSNSEETPVSTTLTATVTRAKKAVPSVTILADPQSQTIDAKSTGDLIGTITDVVIGGFEGNSTLTYNQGVLSNGQYRITNVTQNNITVSDTTPNTSTIDITALSADSTTETATIAFQDSEGTTGTSTVTFSLSKAKKAVPSVTILADPQTQTVEYNGSLYGTPDDVTIKVNEGGTQYTYDGTLSSNQTFNITGITGGSDNSNGTITPTTPTTTAGTTGTVTLSYVDSEGTTTTGKTIDFSVGVAAKGNDGVTVEIDPPSQILTSGSDSGSDGLESVDPFTVEVFDSQGSYTYVSSSPTSGQFTITNESNVTDNNDGTMTPDTPTEFTGVTSTFDVTYVDRGGNSVTVSKTHRVGVVLDGSTGPGIVFTGVWDPSRSYQYDLDSGRRDAVLWSGSTNDVDTYFATLDPSTGEEPDYDGDTTYWEVLGTQDFFVAAKIGIFEESFIQNTLNIGTNNSLTSFDANITLYGGSTQPYFSLGQSPVGQYNQPGIFIGRDTDDEFKLSLVGTGGSLLWDGFDLTVSGAINALSGNISGDLDVSGSLQIGGLVLIGDSVSPPSLVIETDTTTFTVTDELTDGSGVSAETDTFGNETADVVELDVTVSDNSSQNGYDVTLAYDQQTIELSSGQLPQTFTLIGKGNQSLITTINNTGGPVSNQTASIDVEVDSYITKKSIALNQDGLFTRNRDNEVVPLLSLVGGTSTSSSGGSGGGTMSSFSLSDGSTSQTIEDGDTLTINGGSGIISAVSATDTATISIDTDEVPTLNTPNDFGNNDITANNFILTSDRRLKTDLVPITSGIEKISQLHPFEYTKNSVREIGIIAQDLEKVSPASVHENKDGYKVVDTMALSTLNLSAIKELVEQFVYLEERLKKLEDK